MVEIAYHVSHEQFSPSALLRYVALAERAGFGAVHSSDHFQPWSERQGESGHAFSWLGAAMQLCGLPFGLICAPGPRYHPAIVAQAVATLSEMFPQRLWVALGSGEAINERVTGAKWPAKSTRNERLFAHFHIIKRLLNGETVTENNHVRIEEARLYTLPAVKPLVLGAAISAETAYWMGSWTDGLLTLGQPLEKLKKVVDRFRSGGGNAKPIYVKVQLSYARDEQQAYAGAFDQWRTNIFDNTLLAELWKPSQFDAAAEYVKPEDLQHTVNISSCPQQHVDWLRSYQSLGIDGLILHNVNREQELFIHDFGKLVLPFL